MTGRLILAAVACLGIEQTQTPTFRSGIEKVQVDVLVTRDGRPLTNLTPADFEISDNAVPQQVDSQWAFEEMPLNLVFALDASSSLAGRRAELLRDACYGVLEQLKKDDQAALVVFAEAVVVRSRLTPNLASVRAAAELPLPPGQTSLVDAVQASMVLAESEPGRALILVFTDGADVSSYLKPDAVLETAKRSDAVIYGVVLRGEARPPFMGELAEASGGALFAASPAEIGQAFRNVLEEFRHRYILTYAPTGVRAGGWHKLRVRVKQPGTSVTARPGYLR
jgi:VWFA-related protein